VKPRFDVYKEVSLQIRAIFAEHTSIIEPLSLDEAYLDMIENLRDIASAAEIAEQIRAKIRAETQLTASASVSYNKFLAKLASDYCRPNGLFRASDSRKDEGAWDLHRARSEGCRRNATFW
jgi:DNA polymerase IV